MPDRRFLNWFSSDSPFQGVYMQMAPILERIQGHCEGRRRKIAAVTYFSVGVYLELLGQLTSIIGRRHIGFTNRTFKVLRQRLCQFRII